MSDLSDDHYIADVQNAHIDTRAFEADLANLSQGLNGEALDRANLWSRIHELVMGQLSGPIEQPPDQALICRYLSATKFLWFVRQFDVYLGSASAFEDKADCGLPADYNNCVKRFFTKRKVTPIAWDDYSERFRSGWLVSSWTELTDHHDDHLLWQVYAGGPSGVGITVRYEHLKDVLTLESTRRQLTDFTSGRVAYGSPLTIPPFYKRKIFRNDKEVRFAYRSELLASDSFSIASLKDKIGLRFSPDASQYHIEAVMETWIKWGGKDDYQIAGSG
jgi:hypothetical protein